MKNKILYIFIAVVVVLFAILFFFGWKYIITAKPYKAAESYNIVKPYNPVEPNLESDVRSMYGSNFLKSDSYDIDAASQKKDRVSPYTIKAGVFNFSFSTDTSPLIDNPINEFNDFKIYRNNQIIFPGDTNEFNFFNVSSVTYENKQYYLVQANSGGAHCCDNVYPIVVDGGSIKIGKEFDNADGYDFYFLVKDGEVYVWSQNSSFAYFLSSYALSDVMFYPSFYKFDMKTGDFIPSDNEFKSFYAKFIDEKSAEVEKLENNNYDKNTAYFWPPALTARAIYQLKAGQNQNDVIKQFDADFEVLNAKYKWDVDELYTSLDEINKHIVQTAL